MATLTKSLISKVLKARGIGRVEDMSPVERAEYDRWQKVLKGDILTIEQVLEFCDRQKRIIEGRYFTGELSDKQDYILRGAMQVYMAMIELLNAPEVERAYLAQYLSGLISETSVVQEEG